MFCFLCVDLLRFVDTSVIVVSALVNYIVFNVFCFPAYWQYLIVNILQIVHVFLLFIVLVDGDYNHFLILCLNWLREAF